MDLTTHALLPSAALIAGILPVSTACTRRSGMLAHLAKQPSSPSQGQAVAGTLGSPTTDLRADTQTRVHCCAQPLWEKAEDKHLVTKISTVLGNGVLVQQCGHQGLEWPKMITRLPPHISPAESRIRPAPHRSPRAAAALISASVVGLAVACWPARLKVKYECILSGRANSTAKAWWGQATAWYRCCYAGTGIADDSNRITPQKQHQRQHTSISGPCGPDCRCERRG